MEAETVPPTVTFRGVLLKSLAGHVIIDKVGFPSTILLCICPICFVFLLSPFLHFLGNQLSIFYDFITFTLLAY